MTRREPLAVIGRAILFLVYVVPVIWIVLTSLKTNSDLYGTGWSAVLFSPTVSAYERTFNADLLVAAGQSAVIAIGATAIVLVASIPFAYALARVKGSWPVVVLGALILLQMAPQTATVIPLFQLFSAAGVLDETWGVVLADAALLTPFAIILLRPFFRSVPFEIEEAASVDGASRARIFFAVALPVARNGVVTTATLVFLIVWGEFLYAVNFFLSPEKYPLSALLSQKVTAFTIDWPGLMALAVMTSLPILVVFALTYRFLREGLTVGAVK